jgi:exodeoxyribonuclease X
LERIVARTLDLETTGLPQDGAGVVELGYVDSILEREGPMERWKVLEPIANKFAMFFDPGPEKQMSMEARSTNHILEEDYRGKTPVEELEEYVYKGSPNILVAHSASFEQAFIQTRPGVFWVDTHKVALRLFPDFKHHNNQFMRYALNLVLSSDESMPPHRALPDAFTTAHIFITMLNYGDVTLRQMIEWSMKPAYITRFSFGKYRGEKYEDVPQDYLQWILTQKDFDEGTHAACRRVLYGEDAA